MKTRSNFYAGLWGTKGNPIDKTFLPDGQRIAAMNKAIKAFPSTFPHDYVEVYIVASRANSRVKNAITTGRNFS